MSGREEQAQEYSDLLDPPAFARSVAKLMTGSTKGKDSA
jgi:hypothetical protein